MEIIKKELPLDILELFMLTPLPGSEDHQTLWKQGVWMDPDLNKYDLHHRVVHHPKMSDAEYEQTYRDAWKTYYTPEHIETVARRHGAIPGRNPAEPAQFMTMFKIMFEAEGVHPLEGGIVRLKYRRDRRYGMKIEPIGVFHYKLALESWKKIKIYGRLAWQGWRIGQKVKNDPQAPRIHRSRAGAGGRGGDGQARPVRRDGGRRGGASASAAARISPAPRSRPRRTCASKPPNNLADRRAGGPRRRYDRGMDDEIPNRVYGDPLARWFVTEAYRITDTGQLIAAAGEQLVAAGIPLYRLAYFQLTLHPEFAGKGYFWRRGRGVEVTDVPHGVREGAEYLDNPLPPVFEQRRTIRVHLERASRRRRS